MLVSAYWHGLHPGYYLSFLSVPLWLAAEEAAEAALGGRLGRRGWALAGGPHWFLKMRAFDYLCMGFVLLEAGATLRYWASVYFCLHLLPLLILLLAALAGPGGGKKKKEEEEEKDPVPPGLRRRQPLGAQARCPPPPHPPQHLRRSAAVTRRRAAPPLPASPAHAQSGEKPGPFPVLPPSSFCLRQRPRRPASRRRAGAGRREEWACGRRQRPLPGEAARCSPWAVRGRAEARPGPAQPYPSASRRLLFIFSQGPSCRLRHRAAETSFGHTREPQRRGLPAP